MSKSANLAGQCLTLAALIWSASDTLTVSNAWVREAPPHAEVSAAYLTLHNPGSQTQTLTDVSSPQFQRVEIHTTRMMNGQVHMQRVAEVSIAAHDSVELKPGGYHLMLINPQHTLKSGDIIELTLHFKSAPQITMQAPIRNAEQEEEPHHHHDMNDMKM